MPGTRRRRRRRQFLSRGLDQDCWEPWSVSNRLNNTKSELPFLRPLGTVESFLVEWQTCLVCSPPECSGVGDFDKAKPWTRMVCVGNGAGTSLISGRAVRMCDHSRDASHEFWMVRDARRAPLTGDFALCHCAPVAGRSSLTNLITGIWKPLQ
jgi:hypothetical protein